MANTTAPPTIDRYPLIDATITHGTTGAWVAQVEALLLPSQVMPPVVTIQIEGQTWTGAAVGVTSSVGSWTGTVTGGAGQLPMAIGPSSYQSKSVGQLLDAWCVLAGGGEVRSATIAAAISGVQLDSWQLLHGTLREAIGALARAHGWSWRVLRDGKIWLGVDQWADGRTLAPLATEIDSDWSDGTVELADAWALVPGITWGGHRIVEVTHQLIGGGASRTWIRDRVTADTFSAAAEKVRTELLLGCWWGATVIRQHSDGSCAVQLDDSRLSGQGIERVPLVVGIPGVQITLASGARVYVTWLGADPRYPRVVGYEERRASAGQARLTSAALLASGGVTIDAATVQLGGSPTQPIPKGTDLKTWCDTHLHPTGMGPSGVTPTPLSPSVLSSVSSTE